MATALKRSGPRSWAAERELIELAKTMYLEAIVKRLDASRIIFRSRDGRRRRL
jgi:hypothetical protein